MTRKFVIFALAFFFSISGTTRAQETNELKLTLPQAIQLALKQNKNLQLARLNVLESGAKKAITRSNYFPHIKNESLLLHVTELAGVKIPAGAFGHQPTTGPIPENPLILSQGGLTSYTSGTGLTQPLTQLFKIHEADRAAQADLNISRIKVDEAENNIALKTRQLYFAILITQSKQKAAAEELTATMLKGQETREAVERGRALDAAILESHASELEARQTALTLELQIHDLTLSLNDLMGIPLETKLTLTESDEQQSIPFSRQDARKIAMQHSPEIREAKEIVRKAKAGLSAAKEEYIPDITALARYSYQDGVPLLARNFGTFGVNFSFEIFDGGKRYEEVRASRIRLTQAETNLARLEEDIIVQVETAYDKVEQLRSLVAVTQEALKVRAEAARIANEQFQEDAALASVRDSAKAKLSSARATALEAMLGLSLAEGDLKRIIGETP